MSTSMKQRRIVKETVEVTLWLTYVSSRSRMPIESLKTVIVEGLQGRARLTQSATNA